jgi:hypothetical protein
MIAFVPHRLESSNPELNCFPANLLFAKTKVENGALVVGSALYEPEFSTYAKEGPLRRMNYRNVYGGDCYVTIEYDDTRRKYAATKFVNGNVVFLTDGGGDWDLFFTQVTMKGLVNGERCKFDANPMRAHGLL